MTRATDATAPNSSVVPVLVVLGIFALAANFALVAFKETVSDSFRALIWNLVLVVTFNLILVLAAVLALAVLNLAAAPTSGTPNKPQARRAPVIGSYQPSSSASRGRCQLRQPRP